MYLYVVKKSLFLVATCSLYTELLSVLLKTFCFTLLNFKYRGDRGIIQSQKFKLLKVHLNLKIFVSFFL